MERYMKIGIIDFSVDWYMSIELLDFRAKSELYSCIFRYIYDQEEIELVDKNAKALWIFIKKDIEEQFDFYNKN